MKPLYDLQQEINRLFIAGSKFSKGDPRIQKHIPVFQKLGEKAPVFQKLASDLEELLNMDTQQSAEKLMTISTLLYSILYTQGETTETDAEEKPQQPNVDIRDVNTFFSYIQLKPVIEALTISNPGRLEILKDALERNIFEDSRTFHYLVMALGDKYSELADYVEKTIIPKIGSPILPFLIQGFAFEDKTENIRKLRLLYIFKYEKLQEMVDRILESSLPNLQAEAITILSDNSENEELIIKLADDKNKTVRESAYYALAKLNTRNSLEKLKDVYLKNKSKSNLPAIVGSLASSKLPFFFQEVFNQVYKTYQEFIALDKTVEDKVLVEKLDKLSLEIRIFRNKDVDAVYSLFDELLQDKKIDNLITSKKNVLGYSVSIFSESINTTLNTLNLSKAIKLYAQNGMYLPEAEWKYPFCRAYLEKCIETGFSKEQIYDTFVEAFNKKILYTEDIHGIWIEYDENIEHQTYPDRIDMRWIPKIYDLFEGKLKWNYEFNHALEILDAFEAKESKKLNKLLEDLSGNLGQNDALYVFELMIKREIPNRFELIFSSVAKIQKSNYIYYQLEHSNIWKHFPKEYVPKFQTLYEKTKQDFFNEIAMSIANR